jgi:hypothetical protein
VGADCEPTRLGNWALTCRDDYIYEGSDEAKLL